MKNRDVWIVFVAVAIGLVAVILAATATDETSSTTTPWSDTPAVEIGTLSVVGSCEDATLWADGFRGVTITVNDRPMSGSSVDLSPGEHRIAALADDGSTIDGPSRWGVTVEPCTPS